MKVTVEEEIKMGHWQRDKPGNTTQSGGNNSQQIVYMHLILLRVIGHLYEEHDEVLVQSVIGFRQGMGNMAKFI